MPGLTSDRRRHPISGETYAALRERARALRADGCTMATIMAVLSVSKPTVWKWVRDLPCHSEVAGANASAAAERCRIYPRGSGAYALKLRRAGVPPALRIRLLQEAAR